MSCLSRWALTGGLLRKFRMGRAIGWIGEAHFGAEAYLALYLGIELRAEKDGRHRQP
jgi:hypothetical protein